VLVAEGTAVAPGDAVAVSIGMALHRVEQNHEQNHEQDDEQDDEEVETW
jgi:hypothetical protein